MWTCSSRWRKAQRLFQKGERTDTGSAVCIHRCMYISSVTTVHRACLLCCFFRNDYNTHKPEFQENFRTFYNGKQWDCNGTPSAGHRKTLFADSRSDCLQIGLFVCKIGSSPVRVRAPVDGRCPRGLESAAWIFLCVIQKKRSVITHFHGI